MLLPTAARSFIEDLRCKYGANTLDEIIVKVSNEAFDWVSVDISGVVFAATKDNPRGQYLTNSELVQLAAKLWEYEEVQQAAEAKFNTQWDS